MATISNKFRVKLSKNEQIIFTCELCDYKCYRKFNYDRHILSSKHIKSTNGNILATKNEQNEQNEQKKQIYCCENCGKEYNDRSGLWRHSKKCNFKDNQSEISNKDLIMMLIKENKELKTMMIDQQNTVLEIAKNGTHNTNNLYNNSNNKTFNLNLFLNETCKDAMNIMDFVDSIKLQLSDLENVGKLGYVEGISNIITNNLKALDVTQRPVHCTDKKREVLYIKDEDKWEKEDGEKKKIRKVIKKVAIKNALLLSKFKDAHPDCIKSISPFSDQYNKLIVESMGGPGDNDGEKENKIIKNISKNIIIDK
jgi:hypothetical protein